MDDCKSKLSFKDYVVSKIEFKNNLECDEDQITIDFDFDSKIEFKNDREFDLHLWVELFKDAENNKYPFNFRAELIGFFEIDQCDENKKKIYAEQNSVAILFPYVRALITTYTGLANVNPLILPPINVVKYLENKKKNRN